MSRPLVAADERAHEPGRSSAWTETWELRLVDPVRGIGVVVVVVRRPGERRVSYLASVLGLADGVVVVHEHDIAPPRPPGLELRASGIWAELVCERPFVHWSVGLEAFGLVLDAPDDAVGSGRGLPVAVGMDLEWEDGGSARWLGSAVGDSGYVVSGRAHGELLVGDATIELDGLGARLHRWGTGPRLPGWTTDAAAPSGEVVAGSVRAVADDGTGTVVEWWLEGAHGGALVLASRRRT